jgi:hypothetical protein
MGNDQGMANFKCSASGDYDRFSDFIGTVAGSPAAQTAGVKCQVCGISSAPTDLDTRPGYVQYYLTWGQIIDSAGSYAVGDFSSGSNHAKHEYQVWFVDANGRMLGDTPVARVDAIPYSAVNKTCCDEDQYAVTIAAAMPTGMASLMVVPAFKVDVNAQQVDVFAPLPMGQTVTVTDVTSGSTKTVVTGVIGLTVADPDAFIADPRNAQSFAIALAAQTNVLVQYIIVTLSKVTSGGRRLGASRRLAANINANYEITVPEASSGTTVPTATDISSSLAGTSNLASLQTQLTNEIAASGASTSNLQSAAFTEVTPPSTQTETTPAPVTPSPEGSTGAANRKSPASMLITLTSIAGTFALFGMFR